MEEHLGKKWTEEDLRNAVKKANSIFHVCRILGCFNSHKFVKKQIQGLNLDTSHFITWAENHKKVLAQNFFSSSPLKEILVENSTYQNRASLKKRLYREGLKKRICELCGQNEYWKGKKISLILDHINGHNHDNRIENLRIVCPNCAATLETHCGKNLRRPCKKCGGKRETSHLLCHNCRIESKKLDLKRREATRKAIRPPYKQLLKEINELGYCGTGRKYNVSDKAIRKWVWWYEKNMPQ